MNFYETLGKEEKIYKTLYQALPEAWKQPIGQWNDMIRRFRKHGIKDIPDHPLSNMEAVFTEEEMFEISNREVRCFNNLRYCPPFVHRLEFIKIIYVFRGSVTIYMNNTHFELISGNFCIITPGITHSVFSKNDEDAVINLIMKVSSFAGTFSSILMEQNILSDFFWKILYIKHSNRMLVFACDNDEKLDGWIEKLYDESQRGEDSSSLLMESYVMIFLGIVMRSHMKDLKTMEKLTDEVYALPAIIYAIRDNLKTITIRELAIQFGMQEHDLKRYIVRESGYTFSYLIKDLRLRMAAELLQNTKLSMERIMEEVGYSNGTNFYHGFREYFGKTPLEYRNQRNDILI